MNKYLSKKITFLSFFAIIAVVYCHAYNYYNRFLQPTTIIAEGTTPGAMLQFFISNGLVRFGVPLFFSFSGYLFFCKWEFAWKGYLKKIWTRVRTLVVPYIIWKILAQVVFATAPFQLWYIEDLFKLVIISPLIYWLVKECKWFPILIFGILWSMDFTWLINCEGLLFFTIGSYLAVNKKEIRGMVDLDDTVIDKERYKRNTSLLTIWWVGGCFTYALLSATMGEEPYIPYVLLAMYKMNVLTGVVSVWRQYDIKVGEWQEKKWVKAMVSCTVMVYMAHEPFLHSMTDLVLGKMAFNGAHTLVYFVLPIIDIVGCIGLALLIKKVCPKLHGVLVGGRGM